MLSDNWPTYEEPQSRVGSALKVADILSLLSMLVVTVTIAAVPWLLGGAIPHALLLLQVGVVIASVLALFEMFVRRRFSTRLPMTCVPLLGLGCIGLLQLLPIYFHPALEMRHAALPELAQSLPATQNALAAKFANPRSVMPAETRSMISQVFSLALLAITVFESARTKRQVLVVISGLVLSGTAMAALALSQRFGSVNVVIGNQWKISDTTPFGCFVNPNNAAGWLIVCLSAALVLCGVVFSSRQQSALRSSRHWTSTGEKIWQGWSQLLHRVAGTNTSQLLMVFLTAILIAGIGATLSRAGIVAAILGLMAFAFSRIRSGRWYVAACGLGVILVLSCLFLALIDLDTLVLSELRTLKDPVSESTGRMLHWTDSLRSLLDFPLIGSGLGGYRYGSLPYQRHYTGKWFQRADNQYVEVLVESGIAGLVLFVGFGVIAMITARQVLSAKNLHQRMKHDSLHEWLASAVVLSIVAIAGAAFFDYGVSLPSVAGACVVLVALLERQAVELKAERRQAKSERQVPVTILAGPFIAVWVSAVVSVAILVPDTLAAARIYSVVAPIERQLNRPNPHSLSAEGSQLITKLEHAVSLRPDDIQAQRQHALFLKLMFRHELLQRVMATREMTPAQQENVFRTLNITTLANRVLDQSLPQVARIQVESDVRSCLERYPWHQISQRLMKKSAFALTIATDLAIMNLALSDGNAAQMAASHSRFVEPHGSQSLFLLGQVFVQAGKIEAGTACWDQSLLASENFRAAILESAARVFGNSVALDLYLPNGYAACATSGIELRSNAALREALFENADSLWKTSRPRLTEGTASTRAAQLEAMGRNAEALDWLAECLHSTPGNLNLRKQRARLLEKSGLNAEAYDEWLRIQSFSSDDPSVDESLKRLIRLPPTSRK